jgi:hypothetical protein
MPISDGEARTRWHEIWDDLATKVKDAGDQVIEETSNTLDRDEGLRVIIRDIRYALERDIEEIDPERPVFAQTTRDIQHLLIDAADYGMFDARISGRYTYRITGQLGAADDIVFMVMGEDPEPEPVSESDDVGQIFALTAGERDPKPRRMTGVLNGSDLLVDEDGRFEILLAPDEPASGSWLKTDEHSDMLLVRNIYFGAYQDHRRHWPARLWIECIEGPDRPGPYRSEQLFDGLERVRAGAGRNSLVRSDSSRRIARAAVNEFSDDERYWKRTSSNPLTTFHDGYWRLAPGEALVIEADDLPKTSFWSLGLGAYWMESLDFRFHRVNINSHSVQYGTDGSVRIVIANEDPGAPNWLDAAGHEHGVMLWRWNDPDPLPRLPRTAVVPVADVSDFVPPSGS